MMVDPLNEGKVPWYSVTTFFLINSTSIILLVCCSYSSIGAITVQWQITTLVSHNTGNHYYITSAVISVLSLVLVCTYVRMYICMYVWNIILIVYCPWCPYVRAYVRICTLYYSTIVLKLIPHHVIYVRYGTIRNEILRYCMWVRVFFLMFLQKFVRKNVCPSLSILPLFENSEKKIWVVYSFNIL